MESQGEGNQTADYPAADEKPARPHTPAAGRRAAPRVIRDLRGNVPGQGLMIEVLRRQAESGEIVPETGAVLLADAAAPWRIGALGEIQVGAHLAQLGPEWTVLHSVPVGKGESDIDHVVISQAGVFTINTKRHAGQRIWVAGRGFMVGNHKQPYIRNTSHEAKRAEKMLSLATGMTVPVCGVIALVDPASITRKAPPEGDGVELRIIDSRDLCATVSGRPIFSTQQVATIVAAAAQPGTWHAGPHSIEEPAEIAAAFHALSDRVLDPPVVTHVARSRPTTPTRTKTSGVSEPYKGESKVQDWGHRTSPGGRPPARQGARLTPTPTPTTGRTRRGLQSLIHGMKILLRVALGVLAFFWVTGMIIGVLQSH